MNILEFEKNFGRPRGKKGVKSQLISFASYEEMEQQQVYFSDGSPVFKIVKDGNLLTCFAGTIKDGKVTVAYGVEMLLPFTVNNSQDNFFNMKNLDLLKQESGLYIDIEKWGALDFDNLFPQNEENIPSGPIAHLTYNEQDGENGMILKVYRNLSTLRLYDRHIKFAPVNINRPIDMILIYDSPIKDSEIKFAEIFPFERANGTMTYYIHHYKNAQTLVIIDGDLINDKQIKLSSAYIKNNIAQIIETKVIDSKFFRGELNISYNVDGKLIKLSFQKEELDEPYLIELSADTKNIINTPSNSKTASVLAFNRAIDKIGKKENTLKGKELK